MAASKLEPMRSSRDHVIEKGVNFISWKKFFRVLAIQTPFFFPFASRKGNVVQSTNKVTTLVLNFFNCMAIYGYSCFSSECKQGLHATWMVV